MNKQNFFSPALKAFPILIMYALIASFPFFGAQCGEFINGETLTAKDFYATWQLQSQSGSLIDICPGERVTYSSTNNAVLICPPYTDTLIRAFFVDLNQKLLTYTATQVVYNYVFVDSAGGRYLYLYGQNVNRNLFYQQISTNIKSDNNSVGNVKSLNSSEFFKK